MLPLFLACHCFADDDSHWNYPNSSQHTKAGPEGLEKPLLGNELVNVRSTDDSIKKVVAFYATQCGIEAANWSFLKSDFPSTEKPAIGFLASAGKTPNGSVRVSVLHDLRPTVAHISFTVVSQKGYVDTISITRGATETKTWIQIHRHSAEQSEKGVGSFAVQSLLKSSSNGDVDTVLKQTAEQLNKKLPMTVDKYTRLDTTVALPGGKFNYRYTIFSVDELPEAAEFEKNLKPKLINLYQNGDDMKHLRAVSATLVYSYFLEDGTEFVSFEILADDSYDANAQNTNEDL